jgi:hypothetical protein
MGMLSRLHIRMFLSWNGELATHADVLPWLTNSTHENIDAAIGGAFLSLIVLGATALIEKMASIQG